MKYSYLLRAGVRRLGFDLVRADGAAGERLPRDMTGEEREIYRRVEPYTMTSVERVLALSRAVRYVVENGVAGDFVECGVWRGGSAMTVALTLLGVGEAARTLHLYDTFEGMPAPSEKDARYDGALASDLLAESPRDAPVWAAATLDDVRANMSATGYPQERVRYVCGKVEETIPREAPERIALLRLDTDWYESTKHELEHLYPRLERGGLLIIDDYGHWRGAREATDEYFKDARPAPFFHRIDYTGRMTVKT